MATRKDAIGVAVAVVGLLLLIGAAVTITILMLQQGTAGLVVAALVWGAGLTAIGVKLLMD